MLFLKNIIRAKDEPVVTVAEDTGSQCIVNKKKRKEVPQDIDNEVSRSMTKSRVPFPNATRRVTRSMTKAMRDAKPSGDGRGATQNKSIQGQGASSRRERIARNGRKRKAT